MTNSEAKPKGWKDSEWIAWKAENRIKDNSCFSHEPMDNQANATPKWTLTGCHVCIGTEESFDPCGKDYNEVKARASLIVKAVNVHDLFLKASKQLMTEIKDKRYQGKPSDDTLDMFSRAIANATTNK